MGDALRIGRVVGIYVAPQAGNPMTAKEAVTAERGHGLVGDRYHGGAGTWSGGNRSGPGRQVTLIERETVEAIRRDRDLDLTAADTRRNLVTAGVALNHLVGREFTAGQVRLRGIKLCEPCRHLEQVTGKPVRAPLVHRGGLNAEVVADGVIKCGDPVRW